jgi:hypothetical protein
VLGLLGAYQSVPSWLIVLTFFLFRRLTCQFIIQISDLYSLTGTIPTEIGMMTSLTFVHLRKLSSFAFRVASPVLGLLGAYQSVPSWLIVLAFFLFRRLTCQFIIQISDLYSLTGTIPTEIGIMTSLELLWICKLSLFAFRGLRPCWVFLEHTNHFLVGWLCSQCFCSLALLVNFVFKFQGQTPSPDRYQPKSE